MNAPQPRADRLAHAGEPAAGAVAAIQQERAVGAPYEEVGLVVAAEVAGREHRRERAPAGADRLARAGEPAAGAVAAIEQEPLARVDGEHVRVPVAAPIRAGRRDAQRPSRPGPRPQRAPRSACPRRTPPVRCPPREHHIAARPSDPSAPPCEHVFVQCTPSCTPTPPSPSSTAPRCPRSWRAPRPSAGYGAFALTDHNGAERLDGVRAGRQGARAEGDPRGGGRPRRRPPPHAAGRDAGGLAQPLPHPHARARPRARSRTSRRRRCRWRRSRSTPPGSSA